MSSELPKYSTPERAYDARRAGILPPDPDADKAVMAARKAKGEQEVMEQKAGRGDLQAMAKELQALKDMVAKLSAGAPAHAASASPSGDEPRPRSRP